MRQTPVIAATAALLLLALTGCTGSPTSTPTTSQSSDAAAKGTEPTSTVEPIVAPTTSAASADSPRGQFLTNVRRSLTSSGQEPIAKSSDDQLLKAAQDACAASSAGTPDNQVTVIVNEPYSTEWSSYRASLIILDNARNVGIC